MHTERWPNLVDHIDQNKLNDKIENLREFSRVLNAHNTSRIFGSVKFRGVSYNKNHRRYESNITINGNKKFIGYFNSPEEASSAYEEYKKNNINCIIEMENNQNIVPKT